MSKFFRLCSCEFTKIMKKKSTKVMLIILIISLFASAGISVLTKKMYSLTGEAYVNMDYKKNMRAEIENLKTELNSNEALDEASKNSIQAQIDTLQIAIDNDINLYISYWKSDFLMNDIASCKASINNYKSMNDEELVLKEQEKLDSQLKILKKDDFAGYIKLQKDELKENFDNGLYNKQEYENILSILDLKEKYEIGKVYNPEDSWKKTLVEEIQTLKANIITGIDITTGKALTEKGLKDAEDNIKINEYRIEHNMPPFMTGDLSVGRTRKIYDYMTASITMMVLTIMMIIIAGSSISSEISKGTIKFWSFNPNKRWKILLSKLLVNIAVLIIITDIITILSTILGNIFFGSGEAGCYLYVRDGVVHTINYIIFAVLYNLAVALDILVFILFAMMLSTVTRNTAVAVGVSIATYFGGSTIMQILNMFVKAEWIKFVPLNNLSLVDKIFRNDVSYSASNMIASLTGNISLWFSLGVLGISAFIMIVTMFDSFRKRDIV